jgi:hypothetical protein
MVPVETGSRIGRGAFALVAFTLGGSVMLTASQPQRSTIRAASGAVVSAQTTKCELFWAGELDQSGTGTGPNLTLYRNMRAVPGSSMDLFSGEMIGALVNTSTTTDDPIYGKKLGHKKASNPKQGSGCIFFKRISLATNEAVAWFYPLGSDGSSELKHVMYCPNHVSRNGKVPEYSPKPEGCDTVMLTYLGVSAKVGFPPGVRFVRTPAQRKALEKQLATTFKTKSKVAAIINLLSASGVWYPCDSNGCCRAS